MTFKRQVAALTSLAKQEALAKGMLNAVAEILEQETKASRASELAVIEKELLEQCKSCRSYLDDMKFRMRVREVIDTSLTEHEKDFVLEMVDAIEKTDMALLFNAMVLGERTVPDEDEQRWLYGIALFFLQVWQMRWADKAMERLRQWVAAGSDINKPPKRVYVTKKMLANG